MVLASALANTWGVNQSITITNNALNNTWWHHQHLILYVDSGYLNGYNMKQYETISNNVK